MSLALTHPVADWPQVLILCAAFVLVAAMLWHESRAWRRERRESDLARSVDGLLDDERRRLRG